MLGFGTRLSFAFRCFYVLLVKGRLPYDVVERFRAELTPEPPPAPALPPEDPGHRAVQLLSILQRDGRLVDFLQEEIAPYTDAQIGAAVRDVHANCRSALARYVTLEPVLVEAEGERVRADASDVIRVKLVGAVSSAGEQHGVVRHRGWHVAHLGLPPLPQPEARLIVAPAEIEVA